MEKTSDHKMILYQPISIIDNRHDRKKKSVKIRPFLESRMLEFEEWLKKHDWSEIYILESSHKKAELFQSTLLEKLNLYIPEKIVKFCTDDQPYFTPELKTLDRKRKKMNIEKTERAQSI